VRALSLALSLSLTLSLLISRSLALSLCRQISYWKDDETETGKKE
jgi:hypothetical protein